MLDLELLGENTAVQSWKEKKTSGPTGKWEDRIAVNIVH